MRSPPRLCRYVSQSSVQRSHLIRCQRTHTFMSALSVESVRFYPRACQHLVWMLGQYEVVLVRKHAEGGNCPPRRYKSLVGSQRRVGNNVKFVFRIVGHDVDRQQFDAQRSDASAAWALAVSRIKIANRSRCAFGSILCGGGPVASLPNSASGRRVLPLRYLARSQVGPVKVELCKKRTRDAGSGRRGPGRVRQVTVRRNPASPRHHESKARVTKHPPR